MIRKAALAVVFMAFATCTPFKRPAATPRDSAISMNDARNIYEAFLSTWVGDEKAPVNVSTMSDAASENDIHEFTECAGGNSTWLADASFRNMSELLGGLPYVHLVDPKTWKPRDPGDLLAQGQPVGAAVESGFSHGLMTLSAISFDASHETAAFTYSFVCGGLCGNGGVVLFRKTQSGWIQSEKRCGGWMS